jgi:p-hydroxybenzoate 3-monooxygenase
MNPTERTAVVIIGGGVAGLTLGNLLLRNGVACAILEKHSREYVEHRQRAGALNSDGVRTLREWGLAEVVEGHAADSVDGDGMPLKIDGETFYWNLLDDDADDIFCPQQILVRNLIKVFLRDGGDLRFEAREIAVTDVDGAHPRVSYRDISGATAVMHCDMVAGCDGDRGVSRTAIPADKLTRYAYEHGYAWLAVLADVPADPPAVMAVHQRGFAAQITRGPNVSRFYLQCPLTDTLEQWPDERIWNELETRFGAPLPTVGPITDRQLVPLRSVVYSPVRYGGLFLLGDAAHIVSPMSASGMSLAIHDSALFARAAILKVKENDASLLDSFSDTCLRDTWEAQLSAVSITEVMHNAGDATYEGEFRQQLARAELHRMLA